MRKPFWARKTKKVRVARPKPSARKPPSAHQPQQSTTVEQQPFEVRHAASILAVMLAVIAVYCFYFILGGRFVPSRSEWTKISKNALNKPDICGKKRVAVGAGECSKKQAGN